MEWNPQYKARYNEGRLNLVSLHCCIFTPFYLIPVAAHRPDVPRRGGRRDTTRDGPVAPCHGPVQVDTGQAGDGGDEGGGPRRLSGTVLRLALLLPTHHIPQVTIYPSVVSLGLVNPCKTLSGWVMLHG